MPSFPVYKQLDSMDCGPTCLRMIAKYYGKSYSLQFLRSRSYITKSGVSMMGISDAAESIGFRTKGYRLTWEQLRDEVPLPCIVHWRQRHFVVVYDIRKQRKFFFWPGSGKESKSSDERIAVYVGDPASGLLNYSKKEFLKCWLSTTKGGEREGTALLLESTPDFYRQEDEQKGKLKFMYLLGYLRPYRKYIAQLFLGMLTGSAISLIFPFITQSIVDYGISNSDIAFVAMMLVAQMTLVFGQTANEFIRAWLMLHVTTRISISLISDLLLKLMKLPIAFLDVKLIGDIMQRIGDHNRIRSFLTGSLINIIFAVITLVVYTVVVEGDTGIENCVVLYGWKNGKFIIGDPFWGIIEYREDELEAAWKSRIFLLIRPTEVFKPSIKNDIFITPWTGGFFKRFRKYTT